jgi:hypothetical protein
MATTIFVLIFVRLVFVYLIVNNINRSYDVFRKI